MIGYIIVSVISTIVGYFLAVLMHSASTYSREGEE